MALKISSSSALKHVLSLQNPQSPVQTRLKPGRKRRYDLESFFDFHHGQNGTPGQFSLFRFHTKFFRRKKSTVLDFIINFRCDQEKPVVFGLVCTCVVGHWIKNVMPNVIDTIQPEAVLVLLVVVRDLQDTAFLFRKLWYQDIKSGQEASSFRAQLG
jgi:hypothetical protein